MKLDVKKLLLTGTAIVAVGAFSTAAQAQANLTLSTSGVWAADGGADGSDVANAEAGDNVEIDDDDVLLTITNDGTANDGGGFNHFTLGEITDTSAANNGSVAVVADDPAALTVYIESVDIDGEFTITGNAADGFLTTVTIGDGFISDDGVTITGGAGAGSHAVLQLLGNADFGTGLDLADDGGLAVLSVAGADPQVITGEIHADSDGDGWIDINSGGLVIFADNIGATGDRVGLITIAADNEVEFGGNVFANDIEIGARTETTFDGEVGADTITLGADAVMVTGHDVTADIMLGAGAVLRAEGEGEWTGDIAGAGRIEVENDLEIIGSITDLTAIDIAENFALVLSGNHDISVGTISMEADTDLVLSADGERTITTNIESDGDGFGDIDVTGGGTQHFVGNIGQGINDRLGSFVVVNSTFTITGDLYVQDIELDDGAGEAILQFVGSSAQTVSGTIDGAVASEGEVIVGDGTVAANVTFLGEIGGDEEIGAFTVRENATATLHDDLRTEGEILVQGTLNVDATDSNIHVESNAEKIVLDGIVNITASDNDNGVAFEANGGDLIIDGELNTMLLGGGTLELSSSQNILIGSNSNTTITAGNQIVLDHNLTFGRADGEVSLLIRKTDDFDPTTTAVIDADGYVITIAPDSVLNVGISQYSQALEAGDTITVIEDAYEDSELSSLLADGHIILQSTGLVRLLDDGSNDENLHVIVAFADAADVMANSANAATAQALMDFPGATGTLAQARGNLLAAPTDAEANRIAESLAPAMDGGHVMAALQVTNATFGLTGTRLAEVRTNTVGESGMAAGNIRGTSARMWGQVFGHWGDQDMRNGVPGFDSTTWGLAVGVDSREMMQNGTIGLAFSYANTDVDSDDANSTDTDIDSYQLTLYGDVNLDRATWINGMVAYAWNDVDTTRHNVGGIPGNTASGSFDAHQFTARAEIGHDMAFNEMIVTPSLMAHWMHYNPDSYTETGAGTANLNVDGSNVNVFEVGLGLNAGWDLVGVDGSVFRPNLHAGVRHDFVGDRVETTNSFTGGGAAFRTQGASPARTTGNVGAGLSYHHSGWEFSANYDYEFKSDYDAHAGYVRAGMRF